MGIDYSVALECDVKREFGDGDASRGASAIEECLKAKGRAAAISDLARQSGQDPAEISVALHVYDREGNPVEREAAIFNVGDRLNPGHIFGILIWLGAIRVDGEVPGGMNDQPRIRKLAALKTREDKERCTKLELGPPPSLEEAEAFQQMVKALYLAWVLDVEVAISA